MRGADFARLLIRATKRLMRLRIAGINDLPIKESDRKYHWPLGRRPDDHLGLSELGLLRGTMMGDDLRLRQRPWSSGSRSASNTGVGPGATARVPAPLVGAADPRAVRRSLLPTADPLRARRRAQTPPAPIDRGWQRRDHRTRLARGLRCGTPQHPMVVMTTITECTLPNGLRCASHRQSACVSA
jgi:hypothetical protein